MEQAACRNSSMLYFFKGYLQIVYWAQYKEPAIRSRFFISVRMCSPVSVGDFGR